MGINPDGIHFGSEDSRLDEYLVTEELRKLRARTEARRRFDIERLGGSEPFDADTLDGILSRPPEPPMRIEGLVPWEAGVLAVAQRKTGKTTLCANYARAMLTGEDFLGRFGVRPLDGDIAVLNFEVAGGQLARWLRDAGVPGDRCHLVNLRGRRNPFSDPDDRALLVAHLRSRGVESIVVDPFGRAYTGSSQNDAGEVGSWLVDLDLFVRSEVGAKDLLLTAHAGWNGDRTRGSSALEDWADVFWTMTRDAEATEDDDRPRFFKAEGRDVDVDEDQMVYDADSRRLTLAGVGGRVASRKQRKHDELAVAALDVVAKTPGMSGEQVAQAMKDTGASFQRGAHSKVLQELVSGGHLEVEPGARGAKLYHLPRPTPTYPEGHVPTYPDPYLGVGVGEGEVNPLLARGMCPSCGDPLSGPSGMQKCRDKHQESAA